jgi:hypothetical protein
MSSTSTSSKQFDEPLRYKVQVVTGLRSAPIDPTRCRAALPSKNGFGHVQCRFKVCYSSTWCGIHNPERAAVLKLKKARTHSATVSARDKADRIAFGLKDATTQQLLDELARRGRNNAP